MIAFSILEATFDCDHEKLWLRKLWSDAMLMANSTLWIIYEKKSGDRRIFLQFSRTHCFPFSSCIKFKNYIFHLAHHHSEKHVQNSSLHNHVFSSSEKKVIKLSTIKAYERDSIPRLDDELPSDNANALTTALPPLIDPVRFEF